MTEKNSALYSRKKLAGAEEKVIFEDDLENINTTIWIQRLLHFRKEEEFGYKIILLLIFNMKRK